MRLALAVSLGRLLRIGGALLRAFTSVAAFTLAPLLLGIGAVGAVIYSGWFDVAATTRTGVLGALVRDVAVQRSVA